MEDSRPIKTNYEISLFKCEKGRKMALEMIYGNYKDQFLRLKGYVVELIKTNPGSNIKLKLDRGIFQRVYVYSDASKKGWNEGYRPIIALMVASSKFQQVTIAYTIRRDGSNQMYPIAWVVVEVEDTSSWVGS